VLTREAGGLSTKIQNPRARRCVGNPVELMLSPGQANDLACTEPLLAGCDPTALIGDMAYDADAFIDLLAKRRITPVIPSHPRRSMPLSGDFALYRERHLVERFFNKLKHFRAIATRHDKLARNFLVGIHLAAAIILLN
jgi:transposase